MGVDNKSANQQIGEHYGKYCMLTEIKGNHTYHHIDKACDGGRATLDNGSRLEKHIHQWLHIIENQDHELYELVNECIILYKLCKDMEKKELLQQYHEEIVPEYNKILEKRYKYGK